MPFQRDMSGISPTVSPKQSPNHLLGDTRRGGRSQPHPLAADVRQQQDVHNLDAADTNDREFLEM